MSDDTRIDIAHIDTASYALDAVDELERVRSDRHLRDCRQCRDEVAEFADVAALLASDVTPVAPSAGVRGAVLEQIRTLPQESPTSSVHPSRSAARTGQRRHRGRALGLVAAAAVVVAGAGTATVVATHPWSNSSSVTDAAQTRIERAPDAQRSSKAFRGGTVTVISSRSMNQAVAVLNGVSGVSADTTYQGWYIKSDGPTSAGLLKAGGTNTLTQQVHGATEFDITIEPAGGSAVPTKTPVLAIPMA